MGKVGLYAIGIFLTDQEYAWLDSEDNVLTEKTNGYGWLEPRADLDPGQYLCFKLCDYRDQVFYSDFIKHVKEMDDLASAAKKELQLRNDPVFTFWYEESGVCPNSIVQFGLLGFPNTRPDEVGAILRESTKSNKISLVEMADHQMNGLTKNISFDLQCAGKIDENIIYVGEVNLSPHRHQSDLVSAIGIFRVVRSMMRSDAFLTAMVSLGDRFRDLVTLLGIKSQKIFPELLHWDEDYDYADGSPAFPTYHTANFFQHEYIVKDSDTQLVQLPKQEQDALKELERATGGHFSLHEPSQLARWEMGYAVRAGHVVNIGMKKCGLQELPSSIRNFAHLKVLNLMENELRYLPDEIGVLSSLVSLFLSSNRLMKFPETLGNLTHLVTLSAMKNRLTELPSTIGKLGYLQILRLEDNELTTLPDGIGMLRQLSLLNLGRNQLRTLPTSIGLLVNVKELYLGGNQIEVLPDTLGGLKDLKILKINENPIRSLPRSFKELFSLEALNIFDTNIIEIPGSKEQFPHLSMEGIPENVTFKPI